MKAMSEAFIGKVNWAKMVPHNSNDSAEKSLSLSTKHFHKTHPQAVNYILPSRLKTASRLSTSHSPETYTRASALLTQ